MKISTLAALTLFATPIAPIGAASDDPPSANEANSVEQSSDAEKPQKQKEAKSEEKRTCRYVRLDTSSRRKTKVCRTQAGWRALNNPR